MTRFVKYMGKHEHMNIGSLTKLWLKAEMVDFTMIAEKIYHGCKCKQYF